MRRGGPAGAPSIHCVSPGRSGASRTMPHTWTAPAITSRAVIPAAPGARTPAARPAGPRGRWRRRPAARIAACAPSPRPAARRPRAAHTRAPRSAAAPPAVRDRLHDAALDLHRDLPLRPEQRLEHEPDRLREAGARPVERGLDRCPQAQVGAVAALRRPRASRNAPTRQTSATASASVGRPPVPGGCNRVPSDRGAEPGRIAAQRAASGPGTAPSSTHQAARATSPQRIAHGASTASAQAVRRGGPSSTRPTTLTKQYTASAAVTASAARASAPVMPAATLCVSAR